MDLSSLNAEQRDAVVHTDGPLLILAGAGSGKTRVIVYRIAHLIDSGCAGPGDILAVTFTNKAADEMRSRVEQLVGEECRQVWLSTFHSLCARLLRREAPAIGLTRDFVIYDSSDQLAVVKHALKSLNIDDKLLPPRAALSRISQAKNRMESPDDMRAGGWSLRDDQIAKVYDAYRRALTDAGALDFDDLLLSTLELVETSERVRAVLLRQVPVRPRRRIPGHEPAAVPADPAARRAPSQPVRRRRSRPVDLPVARRRPAQHSRLRARLPRRARRPPRTELPVDAGHPRRRLGRDQSQPESQGQAPVDRPRRRRPDPVRARRATKSKRPISSRAPFGRRGRRTPRRMLAVLYRTNAQSRAIEDALMREGVAYRIIGGVRFYERKEIKDALAYLRLVINPHDDVSFRRVVNVPARGIGKSLLETLDAVHSDEPDAPSPLLAAAYDPATAPRSLWRRLQLLLDKRLAPPRAVSPVSRPSAI